MIKNIIIILLLFLVIYPTKVSSEVEVDKQVIEQTPQEYAKSILTESEFNNLDYIIKHESGWCHTKWNGQSVCPTTPRLIKLDGGSGAYGLCQTMIKTHDVYNYEFMTNPYKQIDWCISYAQRRYGGLSQAKRFWSIHKYW